MELKSTRQGDGAVNDFKPAADDFTLLVLGADGLDRIAPLWEKLNQLHASQDSPFAGQYQSQTFAHRKAELLAKAAVAPLRLVVARDARNARLLGYCVSTAQTGGTGEVESLFLDSECRGKGLGEALIQDALLWMDSIGVSKKKIAVYAGNEQVLGFYSKFGFQTRYLILEKADQNGA
jgi:ribosomal protein S18 acetylase RimI-like enzyme